MGKKCNNSIAEKLRSCRNKCGLSQRQVAEALGVERSTYTGYENGRTEPNLITLVKLSQIFCVEPTTLLPNENSDTSFRDSDSSAPNPIYSLSKDEQSLLIAYRLLSDKDKALVLGKITKSTNKDK